MAAGTVMAMIAGCGSSQNTGARPPTEVGVELVKAQPLTISTELPGRTSAYLIAEVRPQVGGIVQKRLFTEGAPVKAGEVLYQLDPAPYQAAYDSAVAVLAKAEATVMSTRAKAGRYADLATIEAVSKQDDDDAQATLKQDEAEVLSAKAALQSARINLAYTRITAPIAGQVSTSTVTAGALVTASQDTALTTVQQLDPIYVDVTQPSTDVLRLKRELASGRISRAGANKARVKLRLEDGSEYAHEGTLEFTGITVSQTTGTIMLRAVLPNPDGDLLPGMYVHAVLDAGVNQNAIVVPQQGITRDTSGGATALVVNAQNQVEQRKVQATSALGNRWVIGSGLAAGDRLIVQGTQKVKPGDTVKLVVVDSDAAAAATPAAAKPAAN